MNQRYWSSRIQGLVPYTPGEQPKDRTFIKLNTCLLYTSKIRLCGKKAEREGKSRHRSCDACREG